MSTPPSNKRPVKTVDTAFSILQYLKIEDGATLAGIIEEFGLAKSTVYRHLRTLQELGFITNDEGVYYPSLKFIEFGRYARYRKDGFAMAREKVEELAEVTGERVQFASYENGKVYIVHLETGDSAIRANPGLGEPVHPHATSLGKAILAHLPRELANNILDRHGLPALTEETITNREALFEQFATVRERGHSFNDEETLEGLYAIGVPVIGQEGSVLGGLSVSGPAKRMKGEETEREFIDLLLGTTNEIELNLR